jgi:hypothetical protein
VRRKITLEYAVHEARRAGLAGSFFSTGDHNQFFSIPIEIIRRRAGLPPPAPGQPGPFSLGAGGAIGDAFVRSGFRDVEVAHHGGPAAAGFGRGVPALRGRRRLRSAL